LSPPLFGTARHATNRIWSYSGFSKPIPPSTCVPSCSSFGCTGLSPIYTAPVCLLLFGLFLSAGAWPLLPFFVFIFSPLLSQRRRWRPSLSLPWVSFTSCSSLRNLLLLFQISPFFFVHLGLLLGPLFLAADYPGGVCSLSEAGAAERFPA